MPMRLLVVDDAEVVVKLVKMLLTGADWEVWTAASGEEALSTLDVLQPALALVDVQLPGMSGVELARVIKSQTNSRCVVIALSGSTAEADQAAARDAGCDAYLVKPIDTRRFAEQVSTIYQSARGSHERSGG